MFVYWLIFLSFSAAAIWHRHASTGANGLDRHRWDFVWLLCWICLTVLIGLRHEVGGDWSAYLAQLDTARGTQLASALFQLEPAYLLLEWFGANVWGGIYFVNTVCAGIFSWGLLAFCRVQRQPWLAVVISIPVLIIVVGMGYTRQAVAIGLVMLALSVLQQQRTGRFFLCVICAALFHTTALAFAAIGLFSERKYRPSVLVAVLMAVAVSIAVILHDYIANLYHSYIVTEYQSAGAFVRLAMNALPAALFLIFREKFGLTASQNRLWTLMAILALSLLVLLMIVPSSTALDRIGLYFVPLQIFVFSNIPDAIQKSDRSRTLLVLGVIAYYAALQLMWMQFGVYASEWLPYQSYLWT